MGNLISYASLLPTTQTSFKLSLFSTPRSYLFATFLTRSFFSPWYDCLKYCNCVSGRRLKKRSTWNGRWMRLWFGPRPLAGSSLSNIHTCTTQSFRKRSESCGSKCRWLNRNKWPKAQLGVSAKRVACGSRWTCFRPSPTDHVSCWTHRVQAHSNLEELKKQSRI